MTKQLKPVWLKATSTAHAIAIFKRLIELGYEDKRCYRQSLNGSKDRIRYVRAGKGSYPNSLTRGDEISYGLWHNVRDLGRNIKTNATLDKLYDPEFVESLEMEPEITLTLTVNGEAVSPDTLSRETWDNLYSSKQ